MNLCLWQSACRYGKGMVINMGIYDKYNQIGKENIKGTRKTVIARVGENGIKEIIKDILVGKNVRDYTEFNTQKRLLNSYAAMIDLFCNEVGVETNNTEKFAEYILEDYMQASNEDRRIVDLWLMGLTNKGLDNITRDNIKEYKDEFSKSMNENVLDLEANFGPLTGFIEINQKKMELNWSTMALVLMSVGAQTLTIRGSEKSTNGKMFEKLILGTLLTIMGFEYCKIPPKQFNNTDKIFWLSHMDANEREIDATFLYNGQAVNIDIGFIGKGNPEITLDKVTRFGSYKEIGGIPHDMTTIIIVDTVAENSDLFNKAKKVNGHVFEMRKNDWVIEFAKTVCTIMDVTHELTDKDVSELEGYLTDRIQGINVKEFLQ